MDRRNSLRNSISDFDNILELHEQLPVGLLPAGESTVVLQIKGFLRQTMAFEKSLVGKSVTIAQRRNRIHCGLDRVRCLDTRSQLHESGIAGITTPYTLVDTTYPGGMLAGKTEG